ncbi:MAG: MerR family DNA-binding protein [Planctomycetes bacterium]|nr:MerR family DNA-binding protein [Planctomycetota bacterium]
MKTLTRGELAKRCEVNFETVRYYEQAGLIPKPSRTASNYRVYDEETVRRIRFIKRAQELGFTLNEIKELFSLRARPGAKCADVLERAEDKIQNIDEKIRTLRTMRRALVKLKSECHGTVPISGCPILEALDAEAEEDHES